MELQELRSLLITINRYVLPTRELAGRFSTIQSPLIDKGTRRYVSDLQDHTLYIAESIGMFRDMLSNLENTYHAQLNARLAQVMKLLTMISTIFIPLTFIVGVYGMNFKYMPELEYKMGYPIVMMMMLVISLIMLLWFRRKGWCEKFSAFSGLRPSLLLLCSVSMESARLISASNNSSCRFRVGSYCTRSISHGFS